MSDEFIESWVENNARRIEPEGEEPPILRRRKVLYCPYCGDDRPHVFSEGICGAPTEKNPNEVKATCRNCRSRFDIKDISHFTGYIEIIPFKTEDELRKQLEDDPNAWLQY